MLLHPSFYPITSLWLPWVIVGVLPSASTYCLFIERRDSDQALAESYHFNWYLDRCPPKYHIKYNRCGGADRALPYSSFTPTKSPATLNLNEWYSSTLNTLCIARQGMLRSVWYRTCITPVTSGSLYDSTQIYVYPSLEVNLICPLFLKSMVDIHKDYSLHMTLFRLSISTRQYPLGPTYRYSMRSI